MRFQSHSISALVLLLTAAAPAALTQQTSGIERRTATKASAPAQPEVSERTFKLVHLGPEDAAKLVAPYVHPVYGAGVFEAGGIRAITVRETPQMLTRIESLLKEHDRAPTTIVLRFQLIAAESTQTRDPAISVVESQLRGLFRFPGYRLLSEATAMAGMYEEFKLLIPAGEERLELKGHVGSVNVGEGDPSVHLRVSLERPVPVVDATSGGVMAGGLLGTGLTIPLGQTVVMGSTTPGGKIMALILVVRPEIATPRK